MTRVSIRIQEPARKQGIDSPAALAEAADISFNTARRWWHDDPTLKSLYTDIIISLCQTLDVKLSDILKLED